MATAFPQTIREFVDQHGETYKKMDKIRLVTDMSYMEKVCKFNPKQLGALGITSDAIAQEVITVWYQDAKKCKRGGVFKKKYIKVAKENVAARKKEEAKLSGQASQMSIGESDDSDDEDNDETEKKRPLAIVDQIKAYMQVSMCCFFDFFFFSKCKQYPT